MLRITVIGLLILAVVFALGLGVLKLVDTFSEPVIFGPAQVYNIDNKKVLFVFIHGFNGDAVATWKDEKTGNVFPKMISEDQNFGKPAVISLGYP